MRWRTPCEFVAVSQPATMTRPDVGWRNVERIRRIVDLPAPLGPISPTIPPWPAFAGLISKLTPFTARSVPKVLHNSRTTIDIVPSLEHEISQNAFWGDDHKCNRRNDQWQSGVWPRGETDDGNYR